MLPDRVSNPGPLTYESGALPTALRGPAPTALTKAKILYNFGLSECNKFMGLPLILHLKVPSLFPDISQFSILSIRTLTLLFASTGLST